MPISIENLSKSFGETQILSEANYTFDDGVSYAIVGSSGTGKSTLLNLISGLEQSDAGDIKIDGTSIQKSSPNALAALRANQIGFVFQFFYLQPHLSILENIKLPSFVSEKYSEAEYNQRCQKLLELVGMSNKADRKPANLSGGEIQRIAIARALINSPKYILADEPTGNLDQANSDNIINLLLNIKTQFNCTLIIVTHDRAIADRMEHRITINSGKIINEN